MVKLKCLHWNVFLSEFHQRLKFKANKNIFIDTHRQVQMIMLLQAEDRRHQRAQQALREQEQNNPLRAIIEAVAGLLLGALVRRMLKR